MHESPTYQAILKKGLIEGRLGEARRLLLMLGEDRFGEPDEAIRGAVEGIHDAERLERMTRRVYDANILDWDRLLDTP